MLVSAAMVAAERAYAELLAGCRERALLGSCATLLEWDEDTIMPKGGVEHRSRQRALIAGLEHARWLDPKLVEYLDVVEASALVGDPRSAPAVNVRELRRLERRSRKLDRTLVEESARISAIAEHHFALAQNADDFSVFAPWLDRVLTLKREQAKALAEHQEDLYDTLLDEYEPGAKTKELEVLFSALEKELAPLIDKVSRARSQQVSLLRAIPVDAQRRFLESATEQIGFDYSRGRLDESQHPFTAAIGPGDIRITTRFVAQDFSEGFFCGLHELGHGLYDQALPDEHFGTPYGEASSLGLHESQARLWENIVGRRRSFWEHFFPELTRAFSPAFDGVALEHFLRAVNRSAPSLRRVRADEITYNLHVIIRFELERKMISGEVGVRDLRAAWNDAYETKLGLVPRDDREGVLQDGHWSAGMFGYFPTYTLGNMIAAQLFAAAERAVGDLDAAFARGDFSGLLSWLRTNVHHRAGQLPASALVQEATGAPLGHRALIDALTDKAAAMGY